MHTGARNACETINFLIMVIYSVVQLLGSETGGGGGGVPGCPGPLALCSPSPCTLTPALHGLLHILCGYKTERPLPIGITNVYIIIYNIVH